MSDSLDFGLPEDYHVVSTVRGLEVSCGRGCGWTLRAETLTGMPAAVREELLQYHEDWHAKQQTSRSQRSAEPTRPADRPSRTSGLVSGEDAAAPSVEAEHVDENVDDSRASDRLFVRACSGTGNGAGSAGQDSLQRQAR
jgi:hypothetical protein